MAIDSRKLKAIVTLLNAYHQTENIDYEIFMRAADWALELYSPEAVEKAVLRFLRADVKRTNRAFAPSVEELAAEVKRTEEFLRLSARAVKPAPPKTEQIEAKPVSQERLAEMRREADKITEPSLRRAALSLAESFGRK